MTNELTSNDSVLQDIPDPETVRNRLAETLREARLLRQLLRLAERNAKERQRKQKAVKP